MKEVALAELKAQLLAKYGADAEPTISTQLTLFFQDKPSITLRDLTDFENMLVTQLGFPARRRAQWARLHPSTLRSSPKPSASTASRKLSRSFDLGAVPTAAQIVPITRHRKEAAKPRDSPIFPRYENQDSYVPVAEQPRVTDTLRTTFYWKAEESLPVPKQTVDEWGDITKWDMTKYQWEQQDHHRSLSHRKREYREYLNKQVQQKAAFTAAEKLAQAREKLEIAEDSEQQRLVESRQNRAKRQAKEQHSKELLEEIQQRAARKRQLQQAKATERQQVDLQREAELAAEIQLLHSRRAHCLSLTDHNLQAVAERQVLHQQQSKDIKLTDKQKAEELLRKFAEEDQQRRQVELTAARDVQRHNLDARRRNSTAESQHTAHAELFRLQEHRMRQTKQQQLHNLVVLSHQVLEKTQKDGMWKAQELEQAELWRQEQARQKQEDLQYVSSLSVKKRVMKQALAQQVQDRRQAEVQARRLSPAEVKLNRSLVQAVLGPR